MDKMQQGSSHSKHDRGPSGAAAPPVDYETVFTNAKAGMEDVDREHVKKVVYEMSKDSAHYKNEQRKMAQVEERIARMQEQERRLSPAELAAHTRAADAKLAELEAGRDITRTWLHVDMDAFFAAVEELENPLLRGKPFAVGGIGMISTASYAARKFGVRSAMPGFIGIKLCPQLVFVPPNFAKYQAASAATREVFKRYDPAFEAGSLDEAYLDVTDYCREHGVTGGEVGEAIRRSVREETQLTCSVGVAPNRMLAKVCSDLHKPDGQYVLEPTLQRVREFISTLPIRKVPGVGKVTEHTLKAFGIHTCRDVIEQRGLLSALFTPLSVDFFLRVALGLGETHHGEGPREGEVGRKGISCEQTFRAISARQELEAKCREIAVSLAEDIAAEGLKGKTLTLKLKATTFEVRTRALTLDRHISSADDIAAAALRLLRAEMPIELRLMGLRLSNFYEQKREAGQLSLEEMLQRRRPQHAQHAAQQAQHEEGQPGVHGSDGELLLMGGEAGEGPRAGARAGAGAVVAAGRGSQGMSQGELVELSLRDWQQEGTEGETPGGGGLESPEQGQALEGSLGGGQQQQQHAQQAHHAHGQQLPQLGLKSQGALLEGPCGEVASSPASLEGGSSSHVWACGACTFENSRLFSRCQMCGTPHQKPSQQQQQQQAGLLSASKGSKGGGGKWRGGGQAAAGPSAAASRFRQSFLASSQSQPSVQQQQGKQQQNQGFSPAGEVRGGTGAQQARRSEDGPQTGAGSVQSSASGQREGSPQEECIVCSLADGIGPAPMDLPGGSGGGAQPGAANARGCGGNGRAELRPASALALKANPAEGVVAGEGDADMVECPKCRDWVRESELEEHKDWHLAMELQKKEDRHAALLGSSSAQRGKKGPSQPAAGAGSASQPQAQGQKRAAGGQATLTALLKRRKS